MTRMSKQEKRRHLYPRKRKNVINEKTGPKKDALKKGYKEHINALGKEKISAFIPKIN